MEGGPERVVCQIFFIILKREAIFYNTMDFERSIEQKRPFTDIKKIVAETKTFAEPKKSLKQGF